MTALDIIVCLGCTLVITLAFIGTYSLISVASKADEIISEAFNDYRNSNPEETD